MFAQVMVVIGYGVSIQAGKMPSLLYCIHYSVGKAEVLQCCL
jgi:hypothetical protein